MCLDVGWRDVISCAKEHQTCSLHGIVKMGIRFLSGHMLKHVSWENTPKILLEHKKKKNTAFQYIYLYKKKKKTVAKNISMLFINFMFFFSPFSLSRDRVLYLNVFFVSVSSCLVPSSFLFYINNMVFGCSHKAQQFFWFEHADSYTGKSCYVFFSFTSFHTFFY